MAAFFARTENASNTVAALHITVAPVGNAIGAILGGHIISRYVDLGLEQALRSTNSGASDAMCNSGQSGTKSCPSWLQQLVSWALSSYS